MYANGGRNNALRGLGVGGGGAWGRDWPLYGVRSSKVHRMGRVSRTRRGLSLGREGMDRPRLQRASPGGWRQGLQGDRHRLGGAHRVRHPKRLHEFSCARRYAEAASCDRLHAVLVLSTSCARHVARMVPFNQLPAQAGSLAARRARRVRIDPSARGGDKGRGLQPEVPLHGPSCAAFRDRELDGGGTRGDRHARLHDWRCLATAGQDGRRSSRPQSAPPRPQFAAAWEGRRMSVKSNAALGRIALLEAIRSEGKAWDVIAPRYGVTNPDPPWKTSLIAMCECLSVSGALPTLDRRRTEDELAAAVYGEVPAPERQLLALVHTLLRRGLVVEGDLASRMRTVRSRLEAV